ncbi:MAG: hypothetical protein JNL47_06325, partial [Bacteroidia bacterium]|nr:hypothetical protein [Bacteroidia bacterium]
MLYEILHLSLRNGLNAVCVCVCLNKVEAQIQVSDACSLAYELNAANAGTIIEVVADINLDDLVNCSTTYPLPLTVKAGVTLKGTFNLITNPNGSMLYSDSHRSSFYSTSNFLLAMQPCTSSCTLPTVIKNLRIRGPSKSWQEFNSGVDASNNFEPLRLTSGGIIVRVSSSNNTGENCIIENCEIFGFSYCAIETREWNKDITIQNCFIHHNNGSTYAGQGYGVWLRTDNNSGGATGLNVLNNVFDDCKDAIDGTAPAHDRKMDWNIVSNSIQYFGGSINRHNSNGNSPVSWNIPPNCFFFDTEANPDACVTNSSMQNLTQDIKDKSPGNINIDGNIIHNLSSISLNFPGYNDGTDNHLQNIEIRNNTFKNKRDATDANCNPIAVNHGYAHVADNYIENCIGDEAQQTEQFNDSGTENAFGYIPGQAVSYPNSPQPPEFTFQINDASGPLPYSKSNQGTLVTNPGTNLTMSISPVQVNGSSTDLIYIIRTNPSDGNGTINHYNDNQIVTTSTTNISLGNYAHPGLYGIDVMAIDKSVNASGLHTYHASDWKHISLNVIPADDHQLIFDIKDSYSEYHHQTIGSTTAGIYKQVELNGTCIWRQDISEGGDGWQRVVIDLSQPLLINNPCSPGIIPLSLLKFDNSPNVISFSIYIDPNTPVDNRIVNGMLVWIDNVYLKKKGIHYGDNLITDGGIENSDALGSSANQGKPWYYQNAYVFSGCTGLSFGTNRSYDPEQNP